MASLRCPSEIVAMTWADVLWETGRLMVSPSTASNVPAFSSAATRSAVSLTRLVPRERDKPRRRGRGHTRAPSSESSPPIRLPSDACDGWLPSPAAAPDWTRHSPCGACRSAEARGCTDRGRPPRRARYRRWGWPVALLGRIRRARGPPQCSPGGCESASQPEAASLPRGLRLARRAAAGVDRSARRPTSSHLRNTLALCPRMTMPLGCALS